jgi:uncharacterized repeat protein (TIGR03803 family)
MGTLQRSQRSRVLLGIPLVLSFVLTGRSLSAADFVTVHQFNSALDGYGSEAALVQATDGNFYGTTRWGGVEGPGTWCSYGGCGTVFKMTPNGTVTTLHAFSGADGAGPRGALIQARDGNLYGTTTVGGDPTCVHPIEYPGCGTVFQITLGGTLTTLHTFTKADPGSQPIASLIEARDGNFFGTTSWGNDSLEDSGTVFRLTPGGSFTTLHDFNSDLLTEGRGLGAPLVQGLDGNYYGTTLRGGAGYGTAFRMAPDGTVSLLHTFSGSVDGGQPGYNALIQGRDGNLYGLTFLGGAGDQGTIFRMTAGGTVTVLHSFAEHGHPAYTALLQGTDGNFYGTSSGSQTFPGMMFQMTPDGAVTPLHIGGNFSAPLIHARDGNLYGTRTQTDDGNPLGDIVRLASPASCDDTLTLRYAAGTLTLGFTLKTLTPATWTSWLLHAGGVANLWSVPIAAQTSAISFDLPIDGFPNIGDILVVTTLTTQTSSICAAWQVVNTGLNGR